MLLTPSNVYTSMYIQISIICLCIKMYYIMENVKEKCVHMYVCVDEIFSLYVYGRVL